MSEDNNVDENICGDLALVMLSMEKVRASITQLQLGTLTRVRFDHLNDAEQIATQHNMKDSLEDYSTALKQAILSLGNICLTLEDEGYDLTTLKDLMSKKIKP